MKLVKVKHADNVSWSRDLSEIWKHIQILDGKMGRILKDIASSSREEANKDYARIVDNLEKIQFSSLDIAEHAKNGMRDYANR